MIFFDFFFLEHSIPASSFVQLQARKKNIVLNRGHRLLEKEG